MVRLFTFYEGVTCLFEAIDDLPGTVARIAGVYTVDVFPDNFSTFLSVVMVQVGLEGKYCES